MKAPGPMDRTLRNSLRALIEYNWNDELADYREYEGESGHIFEHLVALDNWLDGTHRTPASYIDAKAS